MGQFFEFMGNHPFLFGLMGLLLIMLFTLDSKRSGRKISPNELGLMVNQQNAQIIDIRPKKKFESGYIQGSRNIPLTQLNSKINELQAIESPLIIVCDMGIQASGAVQLINKADTCRLDGGIAGWQASGMPLIEPKEKKTNKKNKKS